MMIKLNDICNVHIPEESKPSNVQLKYIIEILVCIMAEYAIEYLKYDVSDEALYPYIKRYFAGEIRAKDLLHRMLKNMEISEVFHFIPDLSQTFDNEKWMNVFSRIVIELSDDFNVYHIDNKVYKVKKGF